MYLRRSYNFKIPSRPLFVVVFFYGYVQNLQRKKVLQDVHQYIL